MEESKIKLTLMNKNTPVIDFEYDTLINVITEIYHTYPQNEKYAPLGIIDLKIGISKVNLMKWLKNRIIPLTRDGIDEYLKYYKGEYNILMSNIISKMHGFNLSDQYWFKLESDNITWDKGNYYNNDFSEDIGKEIIKKDISNLIIPSSSTNGDLYKRWMIENNERYLLKGSTMIKQEPYNESIATNLYKKVLNEKEYVSYELEIDPKTNKVFSKCKCFINENTELVPAWEIIKTLKQNNDENDYNFFLRCCETLNIKNAKDYMNKLLTCDYILGNSDRHYNNFGSIRDVNTLEFLGMSPIFDTGNSLGIIRNNETTFTTLPFYKDPKKQLRLVDDLTWLDISKIENFPNVAKSILKQNDFLRDEYIDSQIKELKQRINDIIDYKKELEK